MLHVDVLNPLCKTKESLTLSKEYMKPSGAIILCDQSTLYTGRNFHFVGSLVSIF